MFPKNEKYNEPEETNYHDTKVDTVVGTSVVVEGDFVSQGNIVVKGTVSGSVRTAEHLAVEAGARILANVKAGSAVIAGEIKGNLKIKDTLELKSSARVLGDVEAGILIIAPGAGLIGKCNTTTIDFSSLKGESKKDSLKQVLGMKKKRSDLEDVSNVQDQNV